jgi:hypothetical protein
MNCGITDKILRPVHDSCIKMSRIPIHTLEFKSLGQRNTKWKKRIFYFHLKSVKWNRKVWGFHSGAYEELYLLEYIAVQSSESQQTFRKNILPFRLCLVPYFVLLPCVAYSSTLKMEVTCSNEMSVDLHWSIRRYTQKMELLKWSRPRAQLHAMKTYEGGK